MKHEIYGEYFLFSFLTSIVFSVFVAKREYPNRKIRKRKTMHKFVLRYNNPGGTNQHRRLYGCVGYLILILQRCQKKKKKV